MIETFSLIFNENVTSNCPVKASHLRSFPLITQRIEISNSLLNHSMTRDNSIAKLGETDYKFSYVVNGL